MLIKGEDAGGGGPERDEAPVTRTGAAAAVGDTGIEPVTPSV
jgi:hypothetical protein